ATPTLARLCSTTELFPHNDVVLTLYLSTRLGCGYPNRRRILQKLHSYASLYIIFFDIFTQSLLID
ncbi:hypothetical protein, partial [uncultured Paraglaciecola sp.]|uniref:hypothetical protein n=1 Tax=uncultured Paraglaciecola sp. TaxID=1765024 RepID=UPI0030D94DD8